MKPIDQIKAQVVTMMKSENFHILLLEGRPGYGKTTAVTRALTELSIKPAILGAYSTPLGFFNFLNEHSSELILVDDTSGILISPQAMALLKAATWDQHGRARLIRWTSTTERAETDEFIFSGKLIVICNSFPRTPDAQAVRSRALELEIEPTLIEARELLTKAAADAERFPEQKIAQKILKKLLADLSEETLSRISYRTLQRNYEIAIHNPDTWEHMVSKKKSFDISNRLSPHKLIAKLNGTDLKVKEQLKEFERQTGFKRRTFFKYRKQLGLGK